MNFTIISQVYVVDLGADRIYYFLASDDGSTITPDGFIETSPGIGPRQMAFNDGLVYVNGELDTVVEVYTETDDGLVGPLATVRYELGREPGPVEKGAEMKFYNGYLYVSHRGLTGLIIAYEVLSAEDGYLGTPRIYETVGSTPRNFDIAGE